MPNCPQCEYKATRKESLQIHIKSVYEGQIISDHNEGMEEYFERDVKSEVESDVEFNCLDT